MYNFTLDNSSPLTPQGVVELWANLRQAYPNAKKIIASTLDRFVAKFEKEEAYSTLPRLSEEMGDTWLYGTGADPWRFELMISAIFYFVKYSIFDRN